MAAREPSHVVEGRAKIAAAQEVILRAVEGGLVDDLRKPSERLGYGWSECQHARSKEVASRFRKLVEGMGVRVFCEARRKARTGITLHVDVEGGHLTAHPTYGKARHAEG